MKKIRNWLADLLYFAYRKIKPINQEKENGFFFHLNSFGGDETRFLFLRSRIADIYFSMKRGDYIKVQTALMDAIYGEPNFIENWNFRLCRIPEFIPEKFDEDFRKLCAKHEFVGSYFALTRPIKLSDGQMEWPIIRGGDPRAFSIIENFLERKSSR